MTVPPGIRSLNADVAAAERVAGGNPPIGPDIAGRVILAPIRGLTEQAESFCVETNLAGRGFGSWIDRWHEAGFHVRLAFVALASPNLAAHSFRHVRRGDPTLAGSPRPFGPVQVRDERRAA